MDGNGSTPPQTVVTLRPLGSSVALGLAGLAVASLMTAGYDLGWVPRGDARHLGLLVLVTVVPMQAVSALLAFAARDGATGGSFGLQSATWAALAVAHVSAPPGTTSSADGLLFVGAGVLLAVAGATTASAKALVGAPVCLSGVHFVLVSIYELGAGSGWQDAGAILSLAAAAIAAYGVWATQLEDMADRTVVPTLRRSGGQVALDAPYAEQVRDVQHEAGVRRQL